MPENRSSAFSEFSARLVRDESIWGLSAFSRAGGVELRAPDVLRPVDHLPLQVAKVNHVEVHQAEAADAGRRQVHRRRATEAARADQSTLAAFSRR